MSTPLVRSPRVAFLDLDGTLTRDGSIFRGEDGVTLDGALAVARLHERAVEVVPCSGRTVAQLREVARLLGARAFVAELGSVVATDGGATLVRTRPDAPHADALRRAGVAEALFNQFDLEWHAPWHATREHTLLLRGRAEPARVRAFLAEVFPKLDLDFVDNGEIDDSGARAYHVIPAGVGKAEAIARYCEIRGVPRESAVSFGDSEGDCQMAREVARHYWIGGPHEGLPANVRATRARFGEGLLEAVSDLLDPRPLSVAP